MKKSLILLLTLISMIKGLSQQQLFTPPGAPNWPNNKYFFTRNIYPEHGTPSWGDFWWAANGIAHNKDFIFICSVKRTIFGTTSKDDYIIWKIPKGYPLNKDYWNDATVKRFRFTSFTGTSNTAKEFKKYRHIGDIDICVIGGTEYILAPMTGAKTPIIALFRTDDMSFVNFHYLLFLSDVGWCAYNTGDGRIYTSNDDATYLRSYKINPSAVNSSNHNALSIGLLGYTHSISRIQNMQGGCFSPDNSLLYVSSGLPQKNYASDGITVLDTKTWKVVQHSINRARNPKAKGCFELSFNTGEWYNPWGAEPEGLDIFDADDGSITEFSGQLHVLVDDHNALHSSNVSMHHYGVFRTPDTISVAPTQAGGALRSNPAITSLLQQCDNVENNAPTHFNCGQTKIKFSYKKTYPEMVLGYTVVKVEQPDACINAKYLRPCEPVTINNFCAPNGVWFYTETNGKPFAIQTTPVQDGLANTLLSVYKGSCGELREIARDYQGGNEARIIVNDAGLGERIYINVKGKTDSELGAFGIRVMTIAPGQPIFDKHSFIGGDPPFVHTNPVLAIDINGDRLTDLVFMGQYWQRSGDLLNIRTKLSNGDGTYRSVSTTTNDNFTVHWYPPLTGDIDGDGKMDIIFHGSGPKAPVLELKIKRSNGDGSFTSYVQDFDNEGISNQFPVRTGDINGDGKTDIVFFSYNWDGKGISTRIKLSNGDGTFRSVDQVLGHDMAVLKDSIYVSDVTGDGKSDIVIAGRHPSGVGIQQITLISNGDGTFNSVDKLDDLLLTLFNSPSIYMGEINGDKKADILLVSYSVFGGNLSIRSRLSNGDGTYTTVLQNVKGLHRLLEYRPVLADFNGDGKTDILFKGQDWVGCGMNVMVLFSNGDGTWCSQWQTLGDGSAVHKYPALTGFFNADQKADLVLVGQNWSGDGLNIRTMFSGTAGCAAANRIAAMDTGVAGKHLLDTLQNKTGTAKIINGTSDTLARAAQSKPVAAPAEAVRYQLYPNPAAQYVAIQTKRLTALTVWIYNSQGMLIKTESNLQSGHPIDVSSLAPGLYVVEVADHVSRTTKKLKLQVIH